MDSNTHETEHRMTRVIHEEYTDGSAWVTVFNRPSFSDHTVKVDVYVGYDGAMRAVVTTVATGVQVEARS